MESLCSRQFYNHLINQTIKQSDKRNHESGCVCFSAVCLTHTISCRTLQFIESMIHSNGTNKRKLNDNTRYSLTSFLIDLFGSLKNRVISLLLLLSGNELSEFTVIDRLDDRGRHETETETHEGENVFIGEQSVETTYAVVVGAELTPRLFLTATVHHGVVSPEQ